jgi:RHS repeat-associated protein
MRSVLFFNRERKDGRFASLAALFLCCALAAQSAVAETVIYYYTSPQGTVLATADASGNVTSSVEYRPYGTQAAGASTGGPGYTGHVMDDDTGLVYAQARYYDPSIGRFLSADPIGLRDGDLFSTNDYAYAQNDPVMNWDPSGLCAADLDNPSCPNSDPTQPPTPTPTPAPVPAPAPTKPTELPRITVSANVRGQEAGINIPPPVFAPPGGRPLFSRSIMRILLEKADDAASRAIVKKLSLRTLTISKQGFLKPTPVVFGIWALTYSPPLGGCDDSGHCADEAPISSLKDPPGNGPQGP